MKNLEQNIVEQNELNHIKTMVRSFIESEKLYLEYEEKYLNVDHKEHKEICDQAIEKLESEYVNLFIYVYMKSEEFDAAGKIINNLADLIVKLAHINVDELIKTYEKVVC